MRIENPIQELYKVVLAVCFECLFEDVRIDICWWWFWLECGCWSSGGDGAVVAVVAEILFWGIMIVAFVGSVTLPNFLIDDLSVTIQITDKSLFPTIRTKPFTAVEFLTLCISCQMYAVIIFRYHVRIFLRAVVVL